MNPYFVQHITRLARRKKRYVINTFLDPQRVLFYVCTIPKTGSFSLCAGLQNWVNQRLQTRYPNFTHVVHCHSFRSWTRHFGKRLQGSLRDMFQMFPKEGMLGIQRPIVFQLFRHPWDQIVSSFFHHHFYDSDKSFKKQLTKGHFIAFLENERYHIQQLWREYEKEFGFCRTQCQTIHWDTASPYRAHFIRTQYCDVIFFPMELLKNTKAIESILSLCLPQVDWKDINIPHINKYKSSWSRDAFRETLESEAPEQKKTLEILYSDLLAFFYQNENPVSSLSKT